MCSKFLVKKKKILKKIYIICLSAILPVTEDFFKNLKISKFLTENFIDIPKKCIILLQTLKLQTNYVKKNFSRIFLYIRDGLKGHKNQKKNFIYYQLTRTHFAARQTFLLVIKLSWVVLNIECLGFILFFLGFQYKLGDYFNCLRLLCLFVFMLCYCLVAKFIGFLKFQLDIS